MSPSFAQDVLELPAGVINLNRGEIAEMILSGATPIELKREAMRHGMVTLRMAGLHKVKARETSLSEVTRTTMADFITGEKK